LLRSGAADTETHIVHRGATCFAIINIFPYTSGHLLILPYREVADLDALTAEETAELWATVTEAARVVRGVYRPDGLNIGLNLGRPAGGSVPDHLHVHVVPRWTGDSNFMSSIANTQTLPESLGSCTALETLKLSVNQLRVLPASLGSLERLAELDVSSCHLTELPDAFARLSRLDTLNVRNNLIGELPRSVCSCAALRILDARNNELDRVEAEIRRLQALYPGWSPPANLFTGEETNEEQALWDLFATDDLDALDRAIAARQAEQPGWQPSADLVAKIAYKRMRQRLVNAWSNPFCWPAQAASALATRHMESRRFIRLLPGLRR